MTMQTFEHKLTVYAQQASWRIAVSLEPAWWRLAELQTTLCNCQQISKSPARTWQQSVLPFDGREGAVLEASISVRVHTHKQTGQAWTDTDKPGLDTLSPQNTPMPRGWVTRRAEALPSYSKVPRVGKGKVWACFCFHTLWGLLEKMGLICFIRINIQMVQWKSCRPSENNIVGFICLRKDSYLHKYKQMQNTVIQCLSKCQLNYLQSSFSGSSACTVTIQSLLQLISLSLYYVRCADDGTEWSHPGVQREVSTKPNVLLTVFFPPVYKSNETTKHSYYILLLKCLF